MSDRPTLGAVLTEVRTAPGFEELELQVLFDWLPLDQRGRLADKRPQQVRAGDRLTLKQANLLGQTTLALIAIEELLVQDQQALAKWSLDPKGLIAHPSDKNIRAESHLIGANHAPTDTLFAELIQLRRQHRQSQNRHYVYVAPCGHVAHISQRDMDWRLNNANSRVSPFPRLCSFCMTARIALLDRVPGAATADSVCCTCNQMAFERGQHGHDLSRTDIYENLISGVLHIANLPSRLRPEHKASHPKHRLLVKNRDAFVSWAQDYRAEVGAAIAASPELGSTLKPKMNDEIQAEAERLGISLDRNLNPT